MIFTLLPHLEVFSISAETSTDSGPPSFIQIPERIFLASNLRIFEAYDNRQDPKGLYNCTTEEGREFDPNAPPAAENVYLPSSPEAPFGVTAPSLCDSPPPPLPGQTFSGPAPPGAPGGDTPVIGQLSNLERIVWANLHLPGMMPTEVGQLTALTSLVMRDNTFACPGPLPTELGNLPLLRVLDLSNTNIVGVIPSQLGRLTQIQTLNISSNALNGTFPPELSQLVVATTVDFANSSLTTLDLRNNHLLSGVIPDELCSIPWLYFDCSDLLCGCDCLCNSNNSGNGTINNHTDESVNSIN